MTYKLLPHQVKGVEYLDAHHYSILGDGMGLGKTLQAIQALKDSGLPGLVVCPAMLKGTWKEELQKFNGPDVPIVSYASLTKNDKLFRQAKHIIADEAHYLKSVQAKRTNAFHKYITAFKPERLNLLTGTAIKNRVGEFYSLLQLCSYNPHDTSGLKLHEKFYDYWRFCEHFSNKKQFRIHGRTVTQFEGHKNVDELKLYMKDKYLRRKASEVLDLPPIVRKDIILKENEVDHEMWEAYQSKADYFIQKKVASAKAKAKHTADYAKNLLGEGEGPLVIFSDHVEPCAMMAQNLAGKYDVAVITGETPQIMRDEYRNRFQAGKLDVIIATIGAMSVGVTLTASRNMIFNDLPWVPGDIAQAEKRIHRIGQEGNCTVHRMFYGAIDLKIGREITKKLKTIVEIL